MKSSFYEKVNPWLLPLVLILFILEVISFPFVLNVTYSGRSEAPNHVLTYTTARLTWDSATGIAPNGAAVLNLFDYMYPDGTDPDVVSSNGENLIAPGTEGFSIVRLKNNVFNPIKYTAVVYRAATDESLPVAASMQGQGFYDTGIYPLPAGVTANQVIRAVTGTVYGGGIQDFDLSWFWQFYVSEIQDSKDTAFGNKLDPDELTVGIYIVVEDEGGAYISPNVPKTGDDSLLAMYATLMGVSLLALILLTIEWQRERAHENTAAEDEA